MAAAADAPRRALLAGASGLIGRALLGQLLADDRYDHVDVVARRPLAGEETRHPRWRYLCVHGRKLPLV